MARWVWHDPAPGVAASNGTGSSHTAQDGMFDDPDVGALEEGPELWMSSNRGICGSAGSSPRGPAPSRGAATKVESIVYGEADGMRRREATAGHKPGGRLARDGAAVVTDAKGVVRDRTRRTATRPQAVALIDGRADRWPGLRRAAAGRC